LKTFFNPATTNRPADRATLCRWRKKTDNKPKGELPHEHA
jgi:hypothetical protein